MKLRMFFLMLALGVCGAAMESCDDDDDNLNVPEKLQSAFSQKYPEASPKWKTRSNYYIADFHGRNYESEAWFTSGAVWLHGYRGTVQQGYAVSFAPCILPGGRETH